MMLNRATHASAMLALGLLLTTNASTQPQQSKSLQETIFSAEQQISKMISDEEAARSRDPKWRPSHREILSFTVGEGSSVTNFCLNIDGNLLVCNGGDRNEFVFDQKTGRASAKVVHRQAEIRVFSQTGAKLKTWPLKSTAQAICVDPSGAIYIGGMGRVAQLDQTGATVRIAPIPKMANADVSGIAVSSQDLFVVLQSPEDFGFSVFRFDRNLRNPKKVLSGLSGCCGQLDIQSYRGELWVAHNGRHKVERYNRDGKMLSSFGKNDRKAADGFGGCCEPKNIRFASDGTILAAESGPPTVVKRFDLSGKFLGVIATPNIQTGCVRVTVESSKGGGKYFVINSDDGTMHVIAKGAN